MIDQNKVEENIQTLLQTANKTRQEAVLRLSEKVEHVKNDKDGLQTCLVDISDALQAINFITDAILKDLTNLVQNITDVSSSTMFTVVSNEALLEVLINKGVVTEDELKNAIEDMKKKVTNSQSSG